MNRKNPEDREVPEVWERVAKKVLALERLTGTFLVKCAVAEFVFTYVTWRHWEALRKAMFIYHPKIAILFYRVENFVGMPFDGNKLMRTDFDRWLTEESSSNSSF